jgi:hypothetical protein
MSVTTVMVLCFLFAGCSVEFIDDPREAMIGMSQDRVIACIGKPPSRSINGATEIWRYDAATSDARRCTVQIAIKGKLVSNVKYLVVGDQHQQELCFVAIAACASSTFLVNRKG